MSRRDQSLYRDTENKNIAGVCAGLAHYFDVDTTLVRILFVGFALAGGAALFVYIALWLIMGPAPAGYWDTQTEIPPAPTTAPAVNRETIDLAQPAPTPATDAVTEGGEPQVESEDASQQ